MVGPVGHGPLNEVSGSAVLPYQIDFENAPTSTAPAKHVVVAETLDPNLDLSTFQLNDDFVWRRGSEDAAGAQNFGTTVRRLSDGKSLDVAVQADLNYQTRQLSVTFQSIDPQTSRTLGGHTGFLPPENGTGQGEASVSYLISPEPDLPTGTEIRSVALVTFDHNVPVATDQVNDEDPSQGIDPAKDALVTIVNPDGTGDGSHRNDASANEGRAVLRLETSVAAASSHEISSNNLELGAVDALLDSAGSGHRQSAPNNLAPALMLKPYPRFSLIANLVTRSNPPQKKP